MKTTSQNPKNQYFQNIEDLQDYPYHSPFLPHAIVLTGGIASGKSSCAKILEGLGFAVVCADRIAHSVLESSADLLVEVFGREILLDSTCLESSAKSSVDSSLDLSSDMTKGNKIHKKMDKKNNQKINRNILGKIVFADEKKRKLLESITHPQIHSQIYAKAQELEQQITQNPQKDAKKYYFLDIPLFFEGGGKERYNARFSLSIITSKAIQIKRILSRDSLTLEQAQARIEAQMLSATKMQKSDFVLFNNTTLEELESSLKDFITMLDLCEGKISKS